MLKYEIKEINNKQYDYHYSDDGYCIERDGVLYTDAIDVLNSNKVYTETDIKIEHEDESITNEETDSFEGGND